MATRTATSRAPSLICTISAAFASGASLSSSSSWVVLMIWASSSSFWATWSFSEALSTVLSFAIVVNDSERTASMMAPAKARPNDSPKEPPAEFTPAASLTRSSEMGDSV